MTIIDNIYDEIPDSARFCASMPYEPTVYFDDEIELMDAIVEYLKDSEDARESWDEAHLEELSADGWSSDDIDEIYFDACRFQAEEYAGRVMDEGEVEIFGLTIERL